MEDAVYSPVPKKVKKVEEPQQLNFYDALRLVVKGDKATKFEWGNTNIYILIEDGKLKIHLYDDLNHPLIVQGADIEGIDWVIL